MLREINNLLLAKLGNSYGLIEDEIILIRDEQTKELKLIDTINGSCSAYCQPKINFNEHTIKKKRRKGIRKMNFVFEVHFSYYSFSIPKCS